MAEWEEAVRLLADKRTRAKSLVRTEVDWEANGVNEYFAEVCFRQGKVQVVVYDARRIMYPSIVESYVARPKMIDRAKKICDQYNDALKRNGIYGRRAT